jgi:hypothetical protein
VNEPDDFVPDPVLIARFLEIAEDFERMTHDMLFNFPDMPEEIRLHLTAELAKVNAQRARVRRKLT